MQGVERSHLRSLVLECPRGFALYIYWQIKYRGRLALKGLLKFEFHSLRAIAEGSRPINSRRPTRASLPWCKALQGFLHKLLHVTPPSLCDKMIFHFGRCFQIPPRNKTLQPFIKRGDSTL
jgi:hypothetical protein